MIAPMPGYYYLIYLMAFARLVVLYWRKFDEEQEPTASGAP